LNDALIKKAEDRKLQYNQKAELLNKDYIDFQQKAQMNAFISQERQAQEQNKLVSKKQDLDALADQIDKEMSAERQKVSIQVQDTIISVLKQFNNPKKYQLILSNSGTDNILYADTTYDITKEVIDFLNARLPSK
jgi:outer membrane protein